MERLRWKRTSERDLLTKGFLQWRITHGQQQGHRWRPCNTCTSCLGRCSSGRARWGRCQRSRRWGRWSQRLPPGRRSLPIGIYVDGQSIFSSLEPVKVGIAACLCLFLSFLSFLSVACSQIRRRHSGHAAHTQQGGVLSPGMPLFPRPLFKLKI